MKGNRKYILLLIASCLALVLSMYLMVHAITTLIYDAQIDKMPNEQAATRFSIVDAYGNFQIIVDGDTGVMYSI